MEEDCARWRRRIGCWQWFGQKMFDWRGAENLGSRSTIFDALLLQLNFFLVPNK